MVHSEVMEQQLVQNSLSWQVDAVIVPTLWDSNTVTFWSVVFFLPCATSTSSRWLILLLLLDNWGTISLKGGFKLASVLLHQWIIRPVGAATISRPANECKLGVNLSGSSFSLSKPVLLIYFLLLRTHLENEGRNKVEAQLLFVAFGGLQVFILACFFLFFFITGMLKPFSLDTPGNFLRIFIMFSRMCSNEGQVWNSSAPWVVSVALSACGAPLMEHHFKEQRITCAPSAKALLVCILCLSAWDFFLLFIYFCSRGRLAAIHLPSCVALKHHRVCPSAFFCALIIFLGPEEKMRKDVGVIGYAM